MPILYDQRNKSYIPKREDLDGVEVCVIPEGFESIGEGAFAEYRYVNISHTIREVVIPESLNKICEGAFEGCSSLEKINLTNLAVGNHTYLSIKRKTFKGCVSLKEVHLPRVDEIERLAFWNSGLEKVTIDSVVAIRDKAFKDCKNLKEVCIPDCYAISVVSESAFDGCPDNWEYVLHGDVHIPHKHMDFTRDLSDGLTVAQCFKIAEAAQKVLQDKTFSPILTRKLSNAQHRGQLEESVEKYKKDFQTIGFYDINDKVDVEMKERLTRLFKENAATRGVVPRIIDALTIAATTLGIEPEYIVKSFEDRTFREAIMAMRSCHDGNHFFDVEAALFAFNFDVNTVKQTIVSNPHKDYASVLICKSYLEQNERLLDIAKWIVNHPNTSHEIIEDIFNYSDSLEITPDMSVGAVKACISSDEAKLEIVKIESEYDTFSFKDCECNLPKTEVELGQYKAYIMDASDPRQVMLGYDTNCCQHLDGAGESAMMYGLVNPNAGFWVIEDKQMGKILAQAEIWESDERLPKKEIDEGRALAITEKFIVECDIDISGNCVDGDRDSGLWYEGGDYDEYGNLVDDIEGYIYPENGKYSDDPAITFYSNGDIEIDSAYLSDILEGIAKDAELRDRYNKMFEDQGLVLTSVGKLCEQPTSGEKFLVFDNIEFADDRNIKQFEPIIAKWCKTSPYKMIAMGDGYNEMSHYGNKIQGINPPVNRDILYSMGMYDELVSALSGYEDKLLDLGLYDPDDWVDAVAKGDQRVRDLVWDDNLDNYLPYTDADESCTLMKVDGNVEPHFLTSLEMYYRAHPEEMNDDLTHAREDVASPEHDKLEKKKRKSRGR